MSPHKPNSYPNLFFGNPSPTWTEHEQIIMTNNFTMFTQAKNTHGILPQNISIGVGLFWDFPNIF